MATKKITSKTAEVVTPPNTFEEEIELAINNVCVSAPEFKEILKDELSSLRKRVLDAHKLYTDQEISEKDKELADARQVISILEQDLASLKTVILRMAVTQYGG